MVLYVGRFSLTPVAWGSAGSVTLCFTVHFQSDNSSTAAGGPVWGSAGSCAGFITLRFTVHFQPDTGSTAAGGPVRGTLFFPVEGTGSHAVDGERCQGHARSG